MSRGAPAEPTSGIRGLRRDCERFSPRPGRRSRRRRRRRSTLASAVSGAVHLPARRGNRRPRRQRPLQDRDCCLLHPEPARPARPRSRTGTAHPSRSSCRHNSTRCLYSRCAPRKRGSRCSRALPNSHRRSFHMRPAADRPPSRARPSRPPRPPAGGRDWGSVAQGGSASGTSGSRARRHWLVRVARSNPTSHSPARPARARDDGSAFEFRRRSCS
jgi:hypothetical protein